MASKRILIAAGLLFTVMCAAPPHYAAAGWFGRFFPQKAPQQPSLAQIYPIQTQQDFAKAAKIFHKRPFGNPELEYSIELPKDWASIQPVQSTALGALSHEIISEDARYQSPVINTMRASVVIQSIQLDHEITAENWLKNYIYSNSCTLQGKLVALNDKKAKANCITTAEGSSVYTHALAMINGSSLVLVEFQTPLYLTGPLNFLAKSALDSFKFILETGRPIEKQKIFSFADVLKFSYPASWTPNGLDTDNDNSMSMQLFSASAEKINDREMQKINGMIRFVVVRRGPDTSLKKETQRLKNYFNNFLGLDFSKLVSSEKVPAASRFIFSREEIYDVSPQKENAHNQTVRLVVLGSKKWYVFAFLLTPMKGDNFYTWACNTRAFDMIVKSIN